MKALTPSRVVAAAALALAALSFGVAHASTGGDGPSSRSDREECDDDRLARNKRNVVAFYTTAFNDKQPERAVARYVGFDRPGQDLDGSGEPHLYIQHNPLAASGAPAFINFVRTFTAAFPGVSIDIRRVVAECDLVVTHGIIGGPGTEPVFGPRGSKVVDIFRIDRRGRIVEHWDVLAQISATSANGNPEV
jgi:predicted SnoaL-like aldol condensation-catalyzing enzyme